jgi:hypothetical protein
VTFGPQGADARGSAWQVLKAVRGFLHQPSTLCHATLLQVSSTTAATAAGAGAACTAFCNPDARLASRSGRHSWLLLQGNQASPLQM